MTGILLLATLLLTLADILHILETTAIGTVLAWVAVIIEVPRLTKKQRLPILVLFGAGVVFSIAGWMASGSIDVLTLASEHLKLVMLLSAVSFIRLVTQVYPASANKGMKSFFATYSGMHLFSSVANFSSLLIIGEQVRNRNASGSQLSPLSYVLMTRGFALAIFWSPFLSMIPLTIALVPGVEMSQVYPWSLSIVAFGFIFSLIEAKTRFSDDLENYSGYPIRISSLILPCLLIIALLVSHQLFPNVHMMALITLISLIVPIGMVIANKERKTIPTVIDQVTTKLPGARPEISLFLVAGFLAAAVKSCISAGLIPSPFSETNALVAAITMTAIFVIGSLGIHQFALVAIFAGLLHSATVTPNLMAVAYIVGVSLAMSSSVFSGVNFILGGQYGVSNREMLKNNLPYSIAMLIFTTVILFMMEAMGIQ